jgi:hypothetical protein
MSSYWYWYLVLILGFLASSECLRCVTNSGVITKAQRYGMERREFFTFEIDCLVFQVRSLTRLCMEASLFLGDVFEEMIFLRTGISSCKEGQG